ncbi:MAG TPA: MerR family transcriptional regulator, partial [Ruminococcaceae bacterium]|nr:MerR family transcriptional regulator [Oscillospiraceae bacterium]
NMGWAIKTKFIDRFNIEQNEFTEKYEKKMCLISLVKIPVDNKILNENACKIKEAILSAVKDCTKDNKYVLDGDILGIIIATAKENGIETQYVLVSIPIIISKDY